jgi:hypothetical protein
MIPKSGSRFSEKIMLKAKLAYGRSFCSAANKAFAISSLA